MSTSNNPLDSQDGRKIDGWVVESCFLDLIPDEEQPNDLDDLAADMDWSVPLASARARVRDVAGANGTCWPSKRSPASLDFGVATRVADWFLDMKAARARAALDFDRARFDYACNPNDSKRDSVRKRRRTNGKTLDAINLDSLSVFGTILRMAQPLPASWGILAALLHSEACASGTTADVSYGMARAFEGFFPASDPQRLPASWRWLFLLLSSHNQALGCNHQQDHLGCIRLLEPLLERFDSDTNGRYRHLAERLVFFPAVLTLADSLQDCHRATEAAWWLKDALDKRDPSAYWRARLGVELASLPAPRPIWAPVKRTQPKLMNCEQRLRYVTCERQIRYLTRPIDVRRCATRWTAALIWTVSWHEDDRIGLLAKIKGVAQSVHNMTEALGSRLVSAKPDDSLVGAIRVASTAILATLDALALTISRNEDNDPVFRFLSRDGHFKTVGLNPKDAVRAWAALKFLLPALQEAITLSSKLREGTAVLKSWRTNLERRLTSPQPNLADVAAKQSMWELLSSPERLCKTALDQRRQPTCVCVATCSDWNCVETMLRLPTTEPLPQTERLSNVASTDYLLRRMARTDAEFARFLGSASLEWNHDMTEQVTPPFEFISLRRWNSFSPNLASRATTTVGGGYLVRVWDKNARRYVGIAIDPGYNYLENLFDEGFTLPDLHVVVVTHAHPDHVENLSNILTLLRERKKRTDGQSRIYLVLTEGVFRRFKSLIDNEIDHIQDVVVVSWSKPNRAIVRVLGLPDPNSVPRTTPEPPHLISIQAVKAIHNDGTDFDSMGVVLRVARSDSERPFSIGFTGDTRYTKDLCATAGFAYCDVLVPHLGSMLSKEAFWYAHESPKVKVRDQKERLKNAIKRLASILTYKNHLYLPGVAMLLCDIKRDAKRSRPLVVLSEFGEELRGGLRADLATKLHRVFGITVLPADVGLRVGVDGQSVRCAVCRQYVLAENVRPVAVSDEDEALMFVCDDCYIARQHELPALLAGLRKAPYDLHSGPRDPASPPHLARNEGVFLRL
jgi:hypothetical protein